MFLSGGRLTKLLKRARPSRSRGAPWTDCASFVAQSAPADVDAFNPAFDVTPTALIAGFATAAGVLLPPFNLSVTALFGSAHNPCFPFRAVFAS
jgi:methylthioribose-1-phosphate isomerase